MAFVAFDDCARAEVRFTMGGGKPAEVTLWFQKFTGTIDQADIDTLADTIDLAVGINWLPTMNGSVNYVETYVRDMTAAISYQATNDDSAAAGTRVGTAPEAHSCVVIQRKSGLVGRSANGRIYAPFGVSADRLNSATWGSTFVALCEQEVQDVNNAVGAIGIWSAIVASRKLRAAGNPTISCIFPVAAWVASPNIAAYRDRSS